MSGKRKTIRLKNYNYAQEGAYCVTVCVNNYRCIFGDVIDKKMMLNKYGEMVDKLWNKIPEHFPHATLDEHVVMPNHIHGIIKIGRGTACRALYDETFWVCENKTFQGTACRAPTIECFGKPTPGSLPTIIRSLKSATTKHINQMTRRPSARLWQRNYYEHIIRNESELNRHREYIMNNPVRWENKKTSGQKKETLFHTLLK